MTWLKWSLAASLGCAAFVASPVANAGPQSDAASVAAYWTPERAASAQARDLVVDSRGLGYLRGADGSLAPYGHGKPAELSVVSNGTKVPMKPPSSGDTTAPSISNLSPASGAVVGGTVAFEATVTDASGVKSVVVDIIFPSGGVQSFTAGNLGGDRYGVTISGFSDGSWAYRFVATDNVRRSPNTATSATIPFTVDLGGGGGTNPGGDVVTNSEWTAGGDVQLAAGRILFEMPQLRGKKITGWAAYVCSGTAVTDTNTGASVIVTAAHCVYDDVAKTFARNVLFIPNQAGTTGTATDSNCFNDPIGCWVPSHGVVDVNWTTRSFPDNVEWDYAYYVVPTAGSHAGAGSNVALEDAVNELTIGFNTAVAGDVTHALGYSYSDDPNFMYCSEAMGVETPGVNWWLPSCDLSGGSSGGPWVQPMDEATGSGPIISVNSWGYTTQPGMAGPLLDGSAECVFAAANDENATVVDRGVVVSNCTD